MEQKSLPRIIKEKAGDGFRGIVSPEEAVELVRQGKFEDLGEIKPGEELGQDDRFRYIYDPNGKFEINGLPAKRKSKGK